MRRACVRERGIALLTVIGVMVTMFGATASVIMVLSARSRAMTDTANETGAFYLAEAGIESAKYEIAKTIDAAGDGIGNVTTETADGNYVVDALDLGNNTWQLTSTGSYGDHDMTIQAVVGQSETTRFPGAAATFLGDYDTVDFKFKWRSNVLIDGGNMPAFAVSSPEFYEILGSDLANEIASGKLSADSIIGTGMNTFMPKDSNKKKKDGEVKLPKDIKKFLDKEMGKKSAKEIEKALKNKEMSHQDLKDKLPSHLMGAYDKWVAAMDVAEGGVELPIQLNESYSEHLQDLSDLYNDAVTRVYEDVIPEADITLALSKKKLDDIKKAEEKLAKQSKKLTELYQKAESLEAKITALLAEGKKAKDEEKKLEKILDKEIPNVLEKQQEAADTIANVVEVIEDDTIVWGTADDPVTVYLTKPLDLKHGVSITGYGTLVVDDKLKLHSGSEIDWHGDVVVIGNDKKKAKLDVHGGDFLVEGNVMVLGYGDNDKDHVKFEVDHHGYAKIDGSVLLSTSFSDADEKKKKNKAELKVNHGDLEINGLFTMLGRDVKLDFKKDSDVTIHGMWQIATPTVTDKKKEKVKLKIDGNLEIIYDQDMVKLGVGELQDLGLDYDLPQISTGLISEEMSFYSWQMVSTQKNYTN